MSKTKVKRNSKLRKTIRISNIEGLFTQSYNSIASPGSIFITKFAVMLGATPMQFGILSAIGQLSQIFQPLGVVFTRKLTSRKGVVLKLYASARLLTVLFGFLPLIFPQFAVIWIFLVLFFFGSAMQAAGMNVWIAWISDMVPMRFRGRFFSMRSQFLVISGLVTGYIVGIFIDLFDPEPGFIARWFSSIPGRISFFRLPNLPYAFIVVFVLATVVGLYGLRILAKQPEKNKEIEEDSLVRIVSQPLKDRNFRKLLFYGFWWMLAIGIGAPFWQPFMIKKLGMSLVGIQVYGTISTIFSIASLRLWGFLIDRFGNKSTMRIALLLGGINPIVWVFATKAHYYFVYIEAVSSGIMWAGAGIIAMNFVLAIAPEGKRQIYSGLFGAFSGIAMMITMLASGAFLPKAMQILGLYLEPEQVLFAISGFARLSAQIPLSWIEEPKAKPFWIMVYYFRQFAKVRIVQFATWMFRRR